MLGDKGTQAKVTGPTPILFVSLGPCAENALRALSEMAKGMESPVQGPFGLLSVDPLGGEILASHWTWLSDFEIPASAQACGLSREGADSEEPLPAIVSSLVRQLRSTEPVADPASPGRVRLSSYVVIDLSVDEAVACGLRLMQVLRRADQGHDMVVLGLTARTATSGSEPEDAWFGRWKQLLALLQNEPLAQKLYLLDGRNAIGTWLDRPEQLHHLGAEFLFHHGLACRGALRQTERRRVSPKENILNICGSFGVRRITTDLVEVTERVAQRLAHEDLADLYQQPLSKDNRWHIEQGAQALVDEIQQIYDRTRRTDRSTSGRTTAASGECVLKNEDVAKAIGKTVNHVCAHDPLVSLCYLLKCLHPKLRRLLTRYRLVEREKTRALVAQTLHRQEEQTYAPMRVWLARPDTKWVDRFTPTEGPASRVVVSRPPSKISYRAGLLFFVMGLAGIASGLFFQERAFVLGGGLLALAATVLMVLPTGWTEQTRAKVPEGREATATVPSVSYRRRVSFPARCAAVMLAVTGVAAIVWSLWPGGWSSAMMLSAGLSALAAVVGLGILLSSPVQIRRDQVKEREAPGHLCPPAWNWWVAGLLCLAGAWGILSLCASAPERVDTSIQWGSHLGGIVCLLAAVVLGRRPRAGSVRLMDRVPSVPEPLAGGITGPGADHDSIREVGAITQWIGRLTLEPDECLLRGGAAETSRNHEVLFDLLATDWDRQLAKAFRKALKTRSHQSLHDLGFEPKAWASCVVGQLENPGTPGSDLAVVFASQVVRAWMDSLTPKELISCLDMDANRFSHLVARIVSANWPATRVEPDMSVGVVAMDKILWEALAPSIQAEGACAVIPIGENGSGDGISVLRFVQGLSQGWRGFPALPGQQGASSQADSVPARELDSQQGAAQTPSC